MPILWWKKGCLRSDLRPRYTQGDGRKNGLGEHRDLLPAVQQKKGGAYADPGEDEFDWRGQETELASDVDDNSENFQYARFVAQLSLLPFGLRGVAELPQ